MIEMNQKKIKESNTIKIISLIMDKKEITKLDISRILGISITTVSKVVNELKDKGVVEYARSMESTGGRKAASIKLKENSKYSLGVAITPNHVKLNLVNLNKDIIDEIIVRIEEKEINSIVELTINKIDEIILKNNINIKNLLGIAFSIPGTVDSQKGIIKNCYFLGIKEYKFADKFQYLDVPIYVYNEANLSAFYEYMNRKNVDGNLLFVSITDGVGLGIIINESIYCGNNDSAGELGHMKIIPNGKVCKCGSRGCLEAYTSKNALIHNYNIKARENLHDINEFSKRYFTNDIIASEVLDEYIRILSFGISNLIMVLDPSTIIIGGDINKLIEAKIDDLKENIYNENVFTTAVNCNIKVADFRESYLLGAAEIPIEVFLTLK